MSLWKDKKWQWWRWEFQFQGNRYTGAQKTKEAALAARESKRQEVKGGQQTETDTGFSEVANLYLDWSQRRHTPKGYQYKRLVYKRFLSFMGGFGTGTFSAIKPQQILKFLNTRPTNRNYNAHLAELSALWTYAQATLGLIHPRDNPFLSIGPLPHTPTIRDIPGEKEVIQLLLAADPQREKPLLLMILHTWGRVDEILRLGWRDVNFEKREITLRSRKNRTGEYRARDNYINNDLYTVLRTLWKARTQETWVLLNPKTGTRYVRRPKMMRAICKRASIKYFGFHSLRHFMATWAKDALKSDTKTIQGILGHSNLRTTEIYVHGVPGSQVELMKQMEGRFG